MPWLVFFNALHVAGIRLAKETAHLAGDSWQQGGTILLDKDEKVLYQVHNKQNPAGIGLVVVVGGRGGGGAVELTVS